MDPERCTARVHDTVVEADTLPRLRQALGDRLYEVLHAGMDLGHKLRPRTLGDPPFQRLLAEAVPHGTTVLEIPADRLGDPTGDDERRATLDGVRVLVPAGAVDEEAVAPDGTGAVRAVLRLPAGRPSLSPGFYLVDGSAGRPRGSDLVRHYVHIQEAEEAPAVWNRVLTALEDSGVSYRAKVASSRLLYSRRDALVVYMDAHDVPRVDLAAVADRLPGIGEATSVFAARVAPGVATACEPSDPRPGMARLSFGQHRARAVADGLVEHAQNPTGGTAEEAVCRCLAAAGARPDAPWRNAEGTGPGPSPAQE
ncbi:T3SS effector HopA1 family protein [Streptomyces sp. NPDC048737]|uniref:T3SS effector HopA1 family protein n=1 Tax=unclassified Streptomyces TaxID=2593676 RepID=UPI003442AB3F